MKNLFAIVYFISFSLIVATVLAVVAGPFFSEYWFAKFDHSTHVKMIISCFILMMICAAMDKFYYRH